MVVGCRDSVSTPISPFVLPCLCRFPSSFRRRVFTCTTSFARIVIQIPVCSLPPALQRANHTVVFISRADFHPSRSDARQHLTYRGYAPGAQMSMWTIHIYGDTSSTFYPDDNPKGFPSGTQLACA